MTNPTWLWSCYKQPPTRLQLNSNYVRMHQGNPTAEQMQAWNGRFFERVPILAEDVEYFRALTYEALEVQWKEKKPENHYSTRTKRK
jgi:hypothetical protein